VILALAKQTEGYTSTPGSLHFPIDKPLPKTLVKELLVGTHGPSLRLVTATR
jgi:hypothetical protein